MLGELVLDRQHARTQPLVVARKESEDRGEERGGVERVGRVVLAQHATLVDAVLEDVGADLLRDRGPIGLTRRAAANLGELGGAVQRDPAHQLGGDVVLRRAARLPDSLVGLAPDALGVLGLRLHDRPQASREPFAAPRMQQDRVERGAVHVVLALVERAVADAHGTRAGVAGELVERRFGQVAPPVDPVHDLERAVGVGLQVGDELHELVGLPVEIEPVQRLQRERRVADPGVAVVPVAFAAGRLGQRRGQRRDGGPGRHVGESLDGERRALERLAPTVVGDPCATDPGAPEPRRRREALGGLVRVGRGGELLGPRQRAEGPLTLLEQPAGAHAVALEPEEQVGRQPEREAGADRVGLVPVVAHERPPRRSAAVVEHGLADQVDVDAALDALDGAHQHVVGVVVEGRARVRRDRVLASPRPERQRIPDDDPSRRHLPGGDQHVRARLVRAGGGHVGGERPDPEVTRLPVEQRAEHARGVEARDAQPSDAAVRRDERARVAVRDERVVGDRGERRRGRGALRPLAQVDGGGHLSLSALGRRIVGERPPARHHPFRRMAAERSPDAIRRHGDPAGGASTAATRSPWRPAGSRRRSCRRAGWSASRSARAARSSSTAGPGSARTSSAAPSWGSRSCTRGRTGWPPSPTRCTGATCGCPPGRRSSTATSTGCRSTACSPRAATGR